MFRPPLRSLFPLLESLRRQQGSEEQGAQNAAQVEPGLRMMGEEDLLVKKFRIRRESERLSQGLRDGCTGGRWEVHRERSAIVVPVPGGTAP